MVVGASADGKFLVEVDTETDFAAKDADFQVFLKDLADFAHQITQMM